jgi:glycosyltransferase involved in cell wall biosynthesis
MVATTRQVFTAALRLKADLYHFHDPELIPVGILLRLCGKRVIYDVHEDVARQILTKGWIPKSLRRAVGRLAGVAEVVGTALFQRVVAATPAIAEHLPPVKTVVVSNFPLAEEIEFVAGTLYAQRPPRFWYAGGITRLRGITEIVDALAQFPAVLDASLDLAGVIRPDSLEQELREQTGWKRVRFHGWITREAMLHLADAARAGIVTFHPVPNHTDAQPNKLFEYMAAGLPVIASDFPRWRAIVETHQCGLLVDPQDAGAIADAMQWILEHPAEAEAMGERGRQAVREHYNWDRESRKLLSVYEELLG